jgi:hypothetical protein
MGKPSDDVEYLPVNRRFAELARRPGGLERPQAVAAADVALVKLKVDYRTEMDRLLAVLADQTARAGQVATVTAAELEPAYRAAAGIQTLGGTFDQPTVSRIAYSLCDLLVRLGAAGVCHRPSIDAHLQALTLAYHQHLPQDGGAAEAALLDGLGKVVACWPVPKG